MWHYAGMLVLFRIIDRVSTLVFSDWKPGHGPLPLLQEPLIIKDLPNTCLFNLARFALAGATTQRTAAAADARSTTQRSTEEVKQALVVRARPGGPVGAGASHRVG